MTTKTTPKNDSMLSFLTSVLKRSVDLPEDVSLLSAGIKVIAEELKFLTQAVTSLATTVQKHNEAISDIYSVQEFILKQLKPSSGGTTLPPINKDKAKKPN